MPCADVSPTCVGTNFLSTYPEEFLNQVDFIRLEDIWVSHSFRDHRSLLIPPPLKRPHFHRSQNGSLIHARLITFFFMPCHCGGTIQFISLKRVGAFIGCARRCNTRWSDIWVFSASYIRYVSKVDGRGLGGRFWWSAKLLLCVYFCDDGLDKD